MPRKRKTPVKPVSLELETALLAKLSALAAERKRGVSECLFAALRQFCKAPRPIDKPDRSQNPRAISVLFLEFPPELLASVDAMRAACEFTSRSAFIRAVITAEVGGQ